MFKLKNTRKRNAVNGISVYEILRDFMSAHEMITYKDLIKGHGGNFFNTKLNELATRINDMPTTRTAKPNKKDAIAYVRYFKGDTVWYVMEKGAFKPDQDAYILHIPYADPSKSKAEKMNLKKIIDSGAKMDIHFIPQTFESLVMELMEEAA